MGETKPTIDKLIERALGSFHQKMQATKALADTQLKYATENHLEAATELAERSKALSGRLQAGNLNAYDYGQTVNAILDCANEIVTMAIPHEVMLAETIFTGLFSSFDAYLYHLLRQLFLAKPERLNRIEAKAIPFADTLKLTRGEIVDRVIDTELNRILRKSYVKIFDHLAKVFGAGTLKGFAAWPQFIECSQRRNVIIHNDGIVGRQYLEICSAEGLKIDKDITLGTKLSVTVEYLDRAIEIISKVGLKLGQVLWRQVQSSSVDAADTHLGQLIFEILKREQWQLALRMGEFGQECARRTHRRPRTERSVKIIHINHAQAAKWSGDHTTAMRLIDQFDWSGSGLEFRLAVECLKESWDEAAKIMKQIGRSSDMMPVYGYVGWPIFRGFRKTPQFLAMFKEVFGVEFAEEVQRESQNPETPPSTDDPLAEGDENAS